MYVVFIIIVMIFSDLDKSVVEKSI